MPSNSDNLRASQPVEPGLIGRPGEDVLALAFAGGGFDTAMQLGVIHALLVSNGKQPDVVVGISAGAVNAAALAEILQAGDGLPKEAEDERLAARVARFREVLDVYQQSPDLLYHSLLPDPYEVEFHKPLQPVDLPIHHKQEREYREDFSRERSGLIALINDLLAIRIPIRTITQAVRRILGWVAAREERSRWKRLRLRIAHLLGLWWMWLKHIFQIAPLVGVVLRAVWNVMMRRIRPGFDFLDQIPLLQRLLRSGSTAGAIILGSRGYRALKRGVSGTVSLAASFLLWLVPIFLLLSPVGLSAGRRIWLLGLLALVPVLAVLLGHRHLTEILLRRYHLLDSLANPHPLRQVFVRLFDPQYYGRLRLPEMLDAALKDENSKDDPSRAPKTLGGFAKTGIYVAPVAADIETGHLTVLPLRTPVVDALLAAMAVVPLFPHQKLKKEDGGEAFYIDGINVANEPTSVLMNLLRNKIHPQARRVRVFAVSSLPVSRSSLSDSDRQYQGLVPVVRRVLALKRFRDAFLERRLTELHTRVADLYVRKTPTTPDTALQLVDGETVVRADIYGIEPDEALDLNQGIARAKNVEERRRLIREAVAKGCRASLETMIQPSITTKLIPGAGSCWRAIRSRLAAEPSLPGSRSSFGPGVAEVCQACALNQGEELSLRPSLRSLTEHASSVWPRRNAVARLTISQEESKEQPQTTECTRQTPQVALLFSGGVFRGVFQMGSIAALSEVGARPQIFAGASVGSITAAMAAHLFVENDPRKRDREIALLASTYLALDRLVLTDRFADFVRRFTLRAGAAEFSVSDADRFFRRYDQGAASGLSSSVRRVVAGLERLFYLTPFELLNLLRALRLSNTSDVVQLLVDSVQDFLDRFEVGEEILGSEPLAFLIAHHVLTKSDDPRETFASFAQRGKTILAVTTNLTKGRLELLPGLDAMAQDPVEKAVLLEALLASSAFPAVFRPRWSWEVFPHSGEICQFVDGGVMDNLPLDAVVQYLREQVINNGLAARPVSSGISVPHLLFAASLEPQLRVPKNPQQIASNWPALRTRARQLSYNRKIDGFRKAQKRFRAFYEAIDPQPGPGEWQPLNIEVVTVKPEWLCSTFGFHPMLGFRRRKQAQNIAHGCALTLGTLYAVEKSKPEWFKEWGVQSLIEPSEKAIETESVFVDDEAEFKIRLNPQVRRDGRTREKGECWFRRGALCPFSQNRTQRLFSNDLKEESTTLEKELHRIYEFCGQKSTHQPPADHLYK